MIPRTLSNVIQQRLFTGKAIILIGARQVGKSTLYKELTKEFAEQTLSLNCDEPEVLELLSTPSAMDLNMLIANKKIIIIDEAQRVKNIGLTLKRIADNYPDIQLLVTGSSSFELHNKLNEPLTGRKYEYYLYPIATQELLQSDDYGLLKVKQSLESRLIYGSYPEILTKQENAKELLINLAGSYLYKDLLTLDAIRRPQLLEKLLIALSLQIGCEVSYNELAKTVGTDSKTIEKYIDLLEKCYIIFRLSGFSRNLRSELKKSKKIYFYDTGIRNAIIQNFAPLALRQDTGTLWENFFICERMKFNHYRGHYANCYFWRNANQQEIDYIEEQDGAFTLFEMKWNPKKSSVSFPKIFLNTYQVKEMAAVTPQNYLQWLT